MSEYNVCILLSTYNGEKYIKEQLDSILLQKNIEFTLYIRDDGSSDETCNILDEYKKNYSNIIIEKGENLGWKKSFMSMLRKAPIADFYAFADQDDVWLDNKLEIAVQNLLPYKDIIALYGSNVTVTDRYLKIKRLYNPKGLDVMSRPMEQLLDGSHMPGGLTYVFTPNLKKLMERWVPAGDFGHDFICYLLAILFGKVIYDCNSYVLYRQHGNNQIGAQKENIQKLILNFKNFFTKSVPYKSIWAEKVIKIYPELLKERDEVYSYLSLLGNYSNGFKYKLKLIRNPNLKRSTNKDTFCLYTKILFNKW